MGMSLVDPRAVGGVRIDLGNILPAVSPGDAPFWVRYMGGDPSYGKDPEGFPAPGGATDYGANPPEMIQQDLSLPSAGRHD